MPGIFAAAPEQIKWGGRARATIFVRQGMLPAAA